MSEARARQRQATGRAARIAGRRQEWLAALLLMARGYRILGFRLQTPAGEIDVLAVKGQVLAVVEIKSRSTIALALEAVSPAQLDRLRRAAASIAAKRSALRSLSIRLDLMVFARGAWPRHIRDAWNTTGV
ncbi:MAG: YraN family protein [Caulobacteraceae bacterium]